MKPAYRLHYAPDNASLIIRLALEELGLPYRLTLVDRRQQAHRHADYLRLNPAGRIPVLETADGPISETAAILLWLSERHGGLDRGLGGARAGTLAPAAGEPERAAFLKWLLFVANTLHPDLILSFYPYRYAPSDAVPAVLDLAAARIHGHLRLLDSVTGQVTGLGGEDPGLIDCYLAPCLRWLALYPVERAGLFDLRQFPALHDMAARFEMRASVRTVVLSDGLGATPFTKPTYANPPQGSAT